MSIDLQMSVPIVIVTTYSLFIHSTAVFISRKLLSFSTIFEVLPENFSSSKVITCNYITLFKVNFFL